MSINWLSQLNSLMQFERYCSITQSYVTVFDIDCSIPGFPVPNCLSKFVQNFVNWVDDAIQPLHLLPSPSPAFNLFQHLRHFQWVHSLHQVAKVLELQLQHQYFQWVFRVDFKIDWFDFLTVQRTLKSLLQHHSLKASILWCSVLCSNAQFIHDSWKKHSFDYMGLYWQINVFAFKYAV